MKQTTIQKVLDYDSQTKIFQSNVEINYSNAHLPDTLWNFNSLQLDGIVISGSFREDQWVCNNKGSHRTVNLDFKEFRRYKTFLLPIKTFVTYLLKQNTARDVQRVLKAIKVGIKETNGFNLNRVTWFEEYLDALESETKRYRYARGNARFLSFLEDETYEEYIETLNKFERPENNTRSLVSFSDLIFFGEVINSFEWNSTEEERWGFFPVLLWWRLTNIIPMRPSEFVEIESDCLNIIGGKHFITIPRKKLEVQEYGALEIEDTLPISEYIYNLVYQAQQMKRELGDTSKYLFSKTFIRSFGIIKHRNLEHWESETQLNVMLNKFYDQIVIKQYNASPDIERIKPGDTRHYAFINMRLQGFNPLTIARVGGHSRLKTQQHYYSHLNEYADSYVYALTRLRFLRSFNASGTIMETSQSAVIQRGRLTRKEDYEHYHKLEPYGACTFDLLKKGCINGGDCRGCPFFHLDMVEQRNPNSIKWLTDYSEVMSSQIYEQITIMNELTKGLKVNISNLKWYSKIDDDFNQKDEALVAASKNLKSLMLKKSICDAVIEVAKNE
jgi:integrase